MCQSHQVHYRYICRNVNHLRRDNKQPPTSSDHLPTHLYASRTVDFRKGRASQTITDDASRNVRVNVTLTTICIDHLQVLRAIHIKSCTTISSLNDFTIYRSHTGMIHWLPLIVPNNRFFKEPEKLRDSCVFLYESHNPVILITLGLVSRNRQTWNFFKSRVTTTSHTRKDARDRPAVSEDPTCMLLIAWQKILARSSEASVYLVQDYERSRAHDRSPRGSKCDWIRPRARQDRVLRLAGVASPTVS